MKRALNKCLSIVLLLSSTAIFAESSDCVNNSVVTCIVPRSQGRNKEVQVVGTVEHTHLYDMESWYGSFSITPEYTQTFRPKRFVDCLFGPFIIDAAASTDDSNNTPSSRSVRVQGSAVSDRAANALVAENFYLPPDFDSVLTFNPRIRNVLINFDLYVGLDEWLCGFYFRIYGPITHTRWDLNFEETINAPGTIGFDEGTFAPSAMPRTLLLASFEEYASGKSPVALNDVTFQGLQSLQILKKEQRDTGFADLRVELGWNFLMCDDYHVGINIQAAAPTGTKKKAKILFDTIIGNDKGELGGGLTAHYVFWRNECEDAHFGFYLDANVTHLFKGKEVRAFDLKGKPLSRYLLAEKMQSSIEDGLEAGGVIPNAQFANEFTPVANLTTQDVHVSIGAQGDVVAMFNFTWCGFSWDVGYNFWGRSCEKITLDDDSEAFQTFKNNKWALKGNSQVFGFARSMGSGLDAGQAVALSATQNSATINGVIANTANAGVDAPIGLATGGSPSTIPLDTSTASMTQINTSQNAILLSIGDLDLGQRTRGISHKVFTHLSYTWDRECWVPFLGIGGFAEFGTHDSRTTTATATVTKTSGSCCLDCAVSQWGVWLKGGISFN